VTNFVEFTPVGNQASRVAEIIGALDMIELNMSGAVTASEAAYPGAGINEIELEIETEKTGTTAMWKVALVTEDLTELDYFVDATTSAGGGGVDRYRAPHASATNCLRAGRVSVRGFLCDHDESACGARRRRS
jgi:hypothetical protein